MTAAMPILQWALLAAAASPPPSEAASDRAPLVWLAAAVLAAAAVAAAVFLHRRRAAARKNSPAALFLELCRAHGLDRSQRALLKQVAQQQRLADAVRLFTEPQWLLQAQVHAAFPTQAGQLQTLCKTLFEKSA